MVGLERFQVFLELGNYLLPYVIFLIYITILLIIRSYLVKSKLIDILLVFSIALFGGLKEAFTWDLNNYRYMFENPDILSVYWIEPLFILLVYFVRLFSDNYLYFFLLYEFITVLFVYLSIKKVFPKADKNYIFAWLSFICFPFMFLNSFGVELRQVFANFVFLYSSISWISGERKKSIIFFIVSILSHYSAIFAVFLWLISITLFKTFFYKIKNKGAIAFFMLITSLILSQYIRDFITFILQVLPSIIPVKEKYISYFLEEEANPISKLFVFNIIGLINALLIDRINKDYYFKIYSFYFTIFGIVLMNLFFSFGPVSRIAYYFLSYLIISIPMISNGFKQGTIIAYLLYIFLFSSFIYGLFYITPYGDYAFLPCKSVICRVFKNAF